jgi:hypothetical protein
VQIYSEPVRQSVANRLLEVRLVGKPGNPTAVGARITVRAKGAAHSQSAEVTSGSGYLGQSEPARWFGLGALDSASPVEVEVRWPDGTTSKTASTAGARRVVVQQ